MLRKKMTGTIKRMTVLLLAAIMTLSLAACGGKAEPDENSGLYEAVTAKAFGLEMAIEDLYDGGMSIELKDGGKAVFTLEGKDYKMKWSRDGKDFQAKGGGAELFGTVEDGVLLLTDLLDTGVDIRLECRSLLRKSSKNDTDSGKDDKSNKDNKDKKDNKDNKDNKDKTDDDSGKSSSKNRDKGDNPFANLFGGQGDDDEDYDINAAREFVGDWHGTTILGESAEYFGESYANVKATSFGRIVIDDAGRPQVYFRTLEVDQINYAHVESSFEADGSLALKGEFGGEAWSYTVAPLASYTDVLEVHGTTGDGELFRLYLKHFGEKWQEGDLPKDFTADDMATYNRMAEETEDGRLLDDLLAFYQDYVDQNRQLRPGATRNYITDEMPDKAFLGAGGAGDSNTEEKNASDPEPEAAGYYELYVFQDDDGTVYSEQDLKDIGLLWYIELKKDGTGVMFVDDELGELSLKWGNGKITDEDGDSYEYFYNDDLLTLTDDKYVLIYKKSGR